MATTSERGNDIDWAKLGWEVAKGLGIGAATVYSFLANQQTTNNSTALEKLKVNASVQAQQNDIELKVYDLVEKALTLEGPSARAHGLAAAALINALTPPPLRGELLSALRAGSTDPTLNQELDQTLEFDSSDEPSPSTEPAGGSTDTGRTSLDVDRGLRLLSRFLSAPVLAQTASGALKGFRIDILVCESRTAAVTDARKRRAQMAADRIQKSGAGATVRVRNLPLLVQARPEYKSVEDEIRFPDRPKSRDAATALESLLGMRPANVRTTTATTANYLMLFYCAE